jgi:hypothetical protein
MEIIDCSCKGINPSCEKCFGRGYYDNSTIHSEKQFQNYPIELPKEKEKTFLEELGKLNSDEIGLLAKKLIDIIDNVSKKQSIILINLFKTKYKRFPSESEKFKRKSQYDGINLLENEKKFLKGKLNEVIQQAIMVNTFIEPSFVSPLSTIDVDI